VTIWKAKLGSQGEISWKSVDNLPSRIENPLGCDGADSECFYRKATIFIGMSDLTKAILDREYSLEMVRHFKDDTDLLNEILDYGSQLILRATSNSPRDEKAICIIYMQLRQVLVHLDGIAVLASAGCCFSAGLQIRSILEIAHAMEWILLADTDAKIRHLWVANLRKRRQWQSRGIPGTPEAALDPNAVSRLSPMAEQLAALKDEVRGIDTFLALPEFSAINAKFQLTYAARGFDKQWYEVYAPPPDKLSIRKIADAIGKIKEYNYIYSHFSAVAHGGDLYKNVVFGQSIFINPVRDPQDVPKLRQWAATLVLRVYRMVLEQYLPSEIAHLDQKYVNEWRARFLKEYSINITPQDTII